MTGAGEFCVACGTTAYAIGVPAEARMVEATRSGVATTSTATAAKTLLIVGYVLQAIGICTGGLFWIIALVLAYVARTKGDSWENSHFTWQIRTIWTALALGVVALLLVLTVVGMVVGIPLAIALEIWVIYRVVKGTIRCLNGQSAY